MYTQPRPEVIQLYTPRTARQDLGGELPDFQPQLTIDVTPARRITGRSPQSSPLARCVQVCGDSLRHIVKFLNALEVTNVQAVCTLFQRHLHSESFYNEMFVRDICSVRYKHASAEFNLKHAWVTLKDLSAKDRLWASSRKGWDNAIKHALKLDTSIGIDSMLGNHATVLETAALREHSHVIQMALDMGADPYIGEHEGDSALHLAVCTNKRRAVECLLSNGIDPARYPTLLTGPLYSDSPDFNNVGDRLFMVRYLLEHGFRRPREVIDVALNTPLSRGRIGSDDVTEWRSMLNSKLASD